LTVVSSTGKLCIVQQQATRRSNMAAPNGLMRARDPDEVKAAMRARGDLTFRELGLLAGSTYGTVDKILNGKSTSRDTAKRIARVLRRPVDELFEVAPSSNKQVDDERQAVA
jgi:DNA-binding XRE family transcriptional regulator